MTSNYSYAGTELDDAALATNWKAYFRSRLRPYVTRRVLEVGAGLGGTTVQLRDGNQTEWLCLEPDTDLARQLDARLRATPSVVPTTTRVGTLEALRPEEKFDCILYIDVLEHIEDDVGELERAARHLTPGGALVVLCPAFPTLFSEMDHALGHFRRYTKRTLAAVFPSSLRRVELFYLDSLGMIASLANKFLLRQHAPNAGQVRFWDGYIIPVSRILDPLLFYAIGRSVIAVYEKPER
jgi:SAM-dependent methyltransferase